MVTTALVALVSIAYVLSCYINIQNFEFHTTDTFYSINHQQRAANSGTACRKDQFLQKLKEP